MASLRRTKLKAKRCGCDVVEVEKCTEISQVIKLMQDKDNTPNDVKSVSVDPAETKDVLSE